MKHRVQVRPDCPGWDVARLGTDRIVPRRFVVSVTYEPQSLPQIEVVVELRHGVPQCRALTVRSTDEGHEVLSRHLRAVKVEDWITTGVAMAATYVVSSDEHGMHTRDAQSNEEQVEATIRQLRDARRRPRRGTDNRLREVAEVYRASIVTGTPTAEVAAHFDVAHRTATLYVKQARDRGFLGAATKGKAGETP